MSPGIGGVALSPRRPRVIASFWRTAHADGLADFAAQGLDIAELRIDLSAFADLDEAAAFCRRFAGFPTLLTLRHRDEGGQFAQDEAVRQDWYLALMPHCDAIDIELSASERLPAVIAAARRQKKTVIASRHWFQTALVEDDWHSAVAAADRLGADLLKTASLCLGESDWQTLSALAQNCRNDGRVAALIGLDDGSDNPFARRARQQLPRLGSCLAFAALEEGSAPGQLSLADTVAEIRAGGEC